MGGGEEEGVIVGRKSVFYYQHALALVSNWVRVHTLEHKLKLSIDHTQYVEL